MLWLISWIVYIFGLLPLGLVAFISWRKLQGKPERTLQKLDWKKDVVYLFTFPLVPSVRSFSPFALKLETWLRVAGIKYEVVYTMKFSKKGQIPYIEFNGEEIADSNIIIKTLKSYFNKNPDSQFSMTDLSLAHSVTSMVENHTALTGFHYRYGYKMKEFLSVLRVAEHSPTPSGIRNWGYVQPYLTKLRSWINGMGRHENYEIWEFANQDLKSISELLGDKKYFLGDSISTVDCVLYGHLTQFMYINIGFPQMEFMSRECKNVISLVERIKDEYWPDWDDINGSRKKLEN